MNLLVSQIFEKLQSMEPDLQREASLELTLLLERALYPGRYDSTHRVLLSKELMAIQLSKDETNEVVKKVCSEVLSGLLHRDAQISLISILGKVNNISSLTAILQFLEVHSDSLNDENAYPLIVSINPLYYPPDLQNEVRVLLERHHTMDVLEQLAQRNSERLDVSIKRVIASIHKLNS